MKKELETRLIALAPRWFDHSFRFECEDGWGTILWSLLKTVLEFAARPDYGPAFRISEVSVEFGKLRIRYRGGDDIVRAAVEMAEWLSVSTCERCGTPGSLRVSRGRVYKALCDGCVSARSTEGWGAARSIDARDLVGSREWDDVARILRPLADGLRAALGLGEAPRAKTIEQTAPAAQLEARASESTKPARGKRRSRKASK